MSFGVPYAWTDPETGERVCPKCKERIAETYDGFGEQVSRGYAFHYLREHTDEKAYPEGGLPA
jgi:hypothetical protein